MNIATNYNQPAFSAKFINNKAFKDVVNYAEKTKRLQVLDEALNRLASANEGDILIIHGKNNNIHNSIFSSFTMYKDGISGYRDKRSVQNLASGLDCPEAASLESIIDLSSLGRKFRKLVGGDVKVNLRAEEIINKYGVNK